MIFNLIIKTHDYFLNKYREHILFTQEEIKCDLKEVSKIAQVCVVFARWQGSHYIQEVCKLPSECNLESQSMTAGMGKRGSEHGPLVRELLAVPLLGTLQNFVGDF